MLVSLLGSGCREILVLNSSNISNPCPEYPDLLTEGFTRYKDPSDVTKEELFDRELCLQSWVKRYEKSRNYKKGR